MPVLVQVVLAPDRTLVVIGSPRVENRRSYDAAGGPERGPVDSDFRCLRIPGGYRNSVSAHIRRSPRNREISGIVRMVMTGVDCFTVCAAD